MEHISYKKQTEIVNFQGREIPLENLTPVLTPEQEAVESREMEQRLYEVFHKYAYHRQTEGTASYIFAAPLLCGAADGIIKLSAAPFLFRKGAQNEQSN